MTVGRHFLLHRNFQDKGCNNADGIRISKTVDGVEHQYILDGTRLLRESWGNNWVEYFYDENGVPVYMLRKDERVGFLQLSFFVTNMQGDVIALCDNTHAPGSSIIMTRGASCFR